MPYLKEIALLSKYKGKMFLLFNLKFLLLYLFYFILNTLVPQFYLCRFLKLVNFFEIVNFLKFFVSL